MIERTSKADFSKSARVIGNMENDFIHPEGWFVKHHKWTPQEKAALLNSVVPNIEKLSQAARRVGRPMIYIQHVLRADYKMLCIPGVGKDQGIHHRVKHWWKVCGALRSPISCDPPRMIL